jgi:DNA-binding MarR family transcriptional regulator
MIFGKNGNGLKHGSVKPSKGCGLNSRLNPARTSLTFNQYLALMIIHELKECSVNELAHKMNIAQCTASQLVDRLVKARLVHRDIHSKDRRRMVVNLSKTGKNMIEICTEFLKQSYGKIISVLDETEQQMLQDGFEKLYYIAMRLDNKARRVSR